MEPKDKQAPRSIDEPALVILARAACRMVAEDSIDDAIDAMRIVERQASSHITQLLDEKARRSGAKG